MASIDPARWTRVLAVLLVCFSAGIWVQTFPRHAGLDFYHYWGVQRAANLAGSEAIGNPYSNEPRWAALLNAEVDRSDDLHLESANRLRRRLDPTGTPFFYWTFGFLPDDYTRAHEVFRLIQWSCLIGSVAWVLCWLGYSASLALAVGGLLSFAYAPFTSDMQVGNVNAPQLFAVLVLLRISRGIRQGRSGAGPWACAFAAGLGLMCLHKPNMLPLYGVLAVHLWSKLSARQLALAAAAGVAAIGLAVWVSGAWLGGFGAWGDWYDLLYGANQAKLANYTFERGNYCLAALLAGPENPDRNYALAAGILALLLASVAVVTVFGRRGASLRERAWAWVEDPLEAVSLGILLSLAASPLVWFHYFVFALVPIVWLIADSGRPRTAPWLALLALLGLGRMLDPVLSIDSPRELHTVAVIATLAWIPLWIALLNRACLPRDRALRST